MLSPAPIGQAAPNFSNRLNLQPQNQPLSASPSIPQTSSTNNLTPTLTEQEIRANIDALQKVGVSNDQVQAYVNNYQKSDSGYSLKTQSTASSSTPIQQASTGQDLATGVGKTLSQIISSGDVLQTLHQIEGGQLDKNRLLDTASGFNMTSGNSILSGQNPNWANVTPNSQPPTTLPNFAGQTPAQQKEALTPSNTTQKVGSIVLQAALGLSPAAPDIARGVGDIVGASRDALETSAVNKTLGAQQNAIDAAGKIVQGKTYQAEPAARTLSQINPKDVTTYDVLASKVGDLIKQNLKSVDTEFAKNPTPQSMDSLTQTVGEGDTAVKVNYVSEALQQLKELYSSTKDPANEVKINILTKKANTTGLTPTEINQLSRTYGTEFGSKAFSKMGDPLTSVNAQAYENTRAGLKTTARSFLQDGAAKQLDSSVSDAIDTKQLLDKMNEKVNALSQRIKTRGFIESLSRRLGSAVDLATFGGPRAFIQKWLFPSNVGLKTLNSLDLENLLQKNLQKVQQLNMTPDETLPGKFLNYAQEIQPGLSIKNTTSASFRAAIADNVGKALENFTHQSPSQGQVDISSTMRLYELKDINAKQELTQSELQEAVGLLRKQGIETVPEPSNLNRIPQGQFGASRSISQPTPKNRLPPK